MGRARQHEAGTVHGDGMRRQSGIRVKAQERDRRAVGVGQVSHQAFVVAPEASPRGALGAYGLVGDRAHQTRLLDPCWTKPRR